MLLVEVRAVPVEPVSEKHRNVIHPCVARCCGQEDPFVVLRDLEETLDPYSLTDHPLLVEYKERVLDVGVLRDAVPAVDHNLVFIRVVLRICREEKRNHLVIPFERIPFASRGYDVEVTRTLHLVVFFSTDVPAVFLVVISKGGQGFARPDASAQDASVMHVLDSIDLIAVELDITQSPIASFLKYQ